MELRDYLHVVRRRWPLIALTTLLCLGVGAILTFTATPHYSSTARLFVSTSQSDASDAYQGGLFSAQRVTSYADLATSRELAKKVADELDLDDSPESLSRKVSATVVPETVILELAVTDTDPRRGRLLAQAYAEQLTAMVKDLETPDGKRNAPIKATIVDAASLPDEPVSPQPLRNLALALALGLLLGVGIAVAREITDTSVASAADVESATDAPVVGAIAYDPEIQRRPLVTSLEPHAPRVEAFRVLRTNMQFVHVDRPDKVFVVTSASREEGKTSSAANLAIMFAQAGQRTLLVDGDLRRPRLATLLDLDGVVGVTTVLVGNIDLDVAVQTHADSGLDVLTSGAVPPNPAELLQSTAMGKLLEELRRRYEMVVIDSPPLLPVTDASLLASQSDGVLLVVRHGKTTRDQLRHAVERLQQVDEQPVGVVLNMVPARGHGSRYGYGYGYGGGAEAAGSSTPGRGVAARGPRAAADLRG